MEKKQKSMSSDSFNFNISPGLILLNHINNTLGDLRLGTDRFIRAVDGAMALAEMGLKDEKFEEDITKANSEASSYMRSNIPRTGQNESGESAEYIKAYRKLGAIMRLIDRNNLGFEKKISLVIE